jgi:hypothetical protein
MEKKNILCLHGCCQNNDIFNKLLKDHIKLSQDKINYYFYEGKYNHSRCGKTWFQPEIELDQIGQDIIAIEEIHLILQELHEYIISNSISVLLGFR